MHRFSLALMIVLMLVLSTTQVVRAKTENEDETNRTKRIEVRQEERTEEREERRAEFQEKLTEARCQVVENRVKAIVERYEANHFRHVQQYQNIVARFQKITEKLRAAGYDVTKLVADAKILNEKVLKLSTDHQAFVAQLQKARGFSCGESEGSFREEMAKARELGKQVRADIKDIQTYYQTVIKADIAAVRAQKPSTDQ